MRNVAARMPADEADTFYDLCQANGTTGAAVLREAALTYIAQHQDDRPAVNMMELPLTG